MCGISGIYGSQQVDKDILLHMVDRLKHRGPDAQGIFLSEDGTAALGHNRLSIIDLSSEANQPMQSTDGRFVIVFNGEVYNFQSIRQELQLINKEIEFRTLSDTETILYAYIQWGSEMVKRLDGMFALAIFDQQQHSLFLCRDQTGKKPLYYYHDQRQFIFASELKALLVHPAVNSTKKINTSAIAFFLHLGYIPGPFTIFGNVCKFPAGSRAWLDKSLQLKIERYWRIEEEIPQMRSDDIGQAKMKLKDLLEKAVNKRLISDVPLGAFLSGGTDSSLVVAVASTQLSSPIKTFNIGFSESKFDESQYARAVAAHLETDHHEYRLSEKEAVGLLDTCLNHFDEPFADTSAIPTMLVSRLAKKEITVCLTGDGGDELFQGYGAYTWADRLNTWPWQLARKTLPGVMSALGSNRFKRASLLMGEDSGNKYSHIFSQEHYFFSQNEIYEKLLSIADGIDRFDYEPKKLENLTPGEQQAMFDFNYYLCDDLLVKVDRASMYHALECRCPFLDKSIVTLSTSLSAGLKKRNGVSKWLLKELLSDYLPKKLVYRSKRGFSIPLSQWLKNDLHYLIDDFLNDEIVEEVGLFNKSYVNMLKVKFLKGDDFLFNRLWVVIIIHKWMKENQ